MRLLKIKYSKFDCLVQYVKLFPTDLNDWATRFTARVVSSVDPDGRLSMFTLKALKIERSILTSPHRLLHIILCYILIVLMSSTCFSQDFVFDFESDPGSTPGFQFAVTIGSSGGICNRDGFGACYTDFAPGYLLNLTPSCGSGCSGSGGVEETTPFLYELVTLNGADYIHMVIGDPATGFAQETYIKGSDAPDASSLVISSWAAVHSYGFNAAPGQSMLQTRGNASAHPEKVAVRQIMGGTWDDVSKTWSCSGTEFCSEYLKDTLARKPRITQNVFDIDMTAEFEIDMRSIAYDDINTTAPIVNKVVITDPNLPNGDEGNYDRSAIQSRHPYTDNETISTVLDTTAGRYTYTENPSQIEGSGGGYTYFADSFDHVNINWCDFYEAEQNQVVRQTDGSMTTAAICEP